MSLSLKNVSITCKFKLFLFLASFSFLSIANTSFAETNRLSRSFCLEAHQKFLFVEGNDHRQVRAKSKCGKFGRFKFENWGGNKNELAIKNVQLNTYLTCLPNPRSAGRNVHGDARKRLAWEHFIVSNSARNTDSWDDYHGTKPTVTIKCTQHHGGKGYLALCGDGACIRTDIKPNKDAVWKIIWQERW